jgi:malonyl-CoA decarboxylase
MRECLEARGGEVSARARAAELGRIYLGLAPEGRRRFLATLAGPFDVDDGALEIAARGWLAATPGNSRRLAREGLRRALEPPRLKLLTQLNALPEGTKFLVDLRADAMEAGRKDPAVAGLDQDLKRLLGAWFDVGFLELRRITWDAPASLLEKLARYEAVHRVRGWVDLKNRLDSDRRLYAFFHPRMPSEPLIFIEVALVKGVADSIARLLDESAPVGDPAAADTAIFYSINNAQAGLAGISFGDFLIKRVVDELRREFPQLKTFATLSPLPGFRRWLEGRLAEAPDAFLADGEAPIGGAGGQSTLGAALAGDEWGRDEETRAALQAPLLRAAARYLVEAKRDDGLPWDSVARFHLSNGAEIFRLAWWADPSPHGLKQSCGVMVNYRYRLDEIEVHHEAYARDGTVAASSAVAKLAAS